MKCVKLFIESKQKAPYMALCFHYVPIIAQLQLQQHETLQKQSLPMLQKL